MSDELKPCKCGEDINENYRIRKLWQGNQSGEVVAIVYCGACDKAEPFKYDYNFSVKEINELALKSWNTRPETNKVPKPVTELPDYAGQLEKLAANKMLNEAIEIVLAEPETIQTSSSYRMGYARCARDKAALLENLRKG